MKRRRGRKVGLTEVAGVESSKDSKTFSCQTPSQGRRVLTIANAFPDVDSLAFGIPYSTLAVQRPMDSGLPDLSRVRDDGAGHCE